jgi:hypothetical protein
MVQVGQTLVKLLDLPARMAVDGISSIIHMGIIPKFPSQMKAIHSYIA